LRAIPAISSGLLLLALVAYALLATGHWTPAYATPLVAQTTQSTGKYGAGGRAASTSYDLDAAYGCVDGGALHLLLTGNIVVGWNAEGQTIGSPIDVFLDTRAGGQNQLLPNNPVVSPADYDLTTMTGLRFDPGFELDWWFCAGADPGYCCGTYVVKAAMAELSTAGGGAGTLLGDVPLGASAPLSGGSNPSGGLCHDRRHQHRRRHAGLRRVVRAGDRQRHRVRDPARSDRAPGGTCPAARDRAPGSSSSGPLRLKDPRGSADNDVGPVSSLTKPGGIDHARRPPWP
jgi:hypothetical protein